MFWQVVRRRMMAGAAQGSVLAAMRTIAAEEGWMALYRGLGVSCIKQAPQTGAYSQRAHSNRSVEASIALVTHVAAASRSAGALLTTLTLCHRRHHALGV
jgi:Mitochondrial carrier protein